MRQSDQVDQMMARIMKRINQASGGGGSSAGGGAIANALMAQHLSPTLSPNPHPQYRLRADPIPLTTDVSGILPGVNGGTGVANTGMTLTIGTSGTAVVGTGTAGRLNVWSGPNTTAGYAALRWDNTNLGLIVGRALAITEAYSGFPTNDDCVVLQLGQDNQVATSDSYGVLQFSHAQQAADQVIGSILWSNREIGTTTKRIAGIEIYRGSAVEAGYMRFAVRAAAAADFAVAMQLTENRALWVGKTSGGLTSAGAVDIAGVLNVDGNTTLTTLTASGAVDLNSTLNVDGNATFDTNTLFVDATNHRVGVGTTSPSVLFHLEKGQNTVTDAIYVNQDAGNAAQVRFQLRNGSTSLDALTVGITGTGFTATGGFKQDVGYISAESNLAGGMSLIARGAAADFRVYTGGFADANLRQIVLSTGEVGFGVASPAVLLHIADATALTNAVQEILRLDHNTSGTAAAGFGTRLLYRLESSTTADRDAVALEAIWGTATDASRSAYLSIKIVQAAAALAESARFDKSATATHTGLMLWDADNATVERVTVGAADSGGTGFKVLRIPN